MSTISYYGGTITPTLVLGYSATRSNRNVAHELLDSAEVAYTLRPAGRLAGTLELFFLTHAEALAADAAHKVAAVFTYVDTDNPAAGMRYITKPGSDTAIKLDDERVRWTLSVPFQEVP